MKEQILLYGVCAAISIASVAITSLFKIIACALARRCGKNLSGNVKEYMFTPIALLLAAGAIYVWLERYMHVENEQLFILLVACFSLGTMLIYWLLFQPTRKVAKAIIRAIARCLNVEPAVDVVQEVISSAEDPIDSNELNLQSDANLTVEEKPEELEDEADKLLAMVAAIKKN